MAKKKVVLKISELETILSDYHHNECWKKTQKWFNSFGKNVIERTKFLSAIMYAAKPLTVSDAKEKVDEFHVLQGDLIKTKAAVTNSPIFFEHNPTEYSYYVVVPSSCSVQPKKYKQVLLARLWPIEDVNGSMKSAFLTSIMFENNKLFYFPPIPDLQLGEFGFLGVFEEISYIENSLLQSSTRVASLSLLGWHMLNAFLVNHFTRPSTDDFKIRHQAPHKDWSFDG